jgi:hypothetical protein
LLLVGEQEKNHRVFGSFKKIYQLEFSPERLYKVSMANSTTSLVVARYAPFDFSIVPGFPNVMPDMEK